MKTTNTKTILFLALAGLAVLATGAKATTVTSQADDLFLSFRVTGGQGAGTDYVVDIGQASNFVNGTGSWVLNTQNSSHGGTNIGNIGSDLSTIFGSSWNTRSDLFYSVSGSPGNAAGVGSDVARTMYASQEETSVGTVGTPLTAKSVTTQGAPSGKMLSMQQAYGSGNYSSQVSPVGIIQNNTDANSYNSFNTTSASFGYFNSPGIEGTFTNGTAGTALDLFRLAPTSPNAPGTDVGSFSLDNSGNVTFASAGAAPEPGRVMLLGLGLGGLLMRRRRTRAA